MACITLETATVTFAIINIFLVSLSTATSLGVLIFWVIQVYTEDLDLTMNNPRALSNFSDLGSILTWLTVSLLALVFGSFLLNGIIKRKPAHMKAYFIYGIVKMCFTAFALAFIEILAADFGMDWPSTSSLIAFFVGFAIYAGILDMIRITYTKFEIEQQQFSHKLLNEKC